MGIEGYKNKDLCYEIMDRFLHGSKLMEEYYALPSSIRFNSYTPDRSRYGIKKGSKRAMDLKYKYSDWDLMHEIQRRICAGEEDAWLSWKMMRNELSYALKEARKQLAS